MSFLFYLFFLRRASVELSPARNDGVGVGQMWRRHAGLRTPEGVRRVIFFSSFFLLFGGVVSTVASISWQPAPVRSSDMLHRDLGFFNGGCVWRESKRSSSVRSEGGKTPNFWAYIKKRSKWGCLILSQQAWYKSEAVGNEDECATISVYLLEMFFFFFPTVTAQCVPFLNAP